MQIRPLTKGQREEQLVLDCSYGWFLEKLRAHSEHLAEGTAQRSFVVFFKTELLTLRQELCHINTSPEFEKRIGHFRNTVSAVESVLWQSKAVIVAQREAMKLEPVWPENLEWN